jgi:hypothetical protein
VLAANSAAVTIGVNALSMSLPFEWDDKPRTRERSGLPTAYM